jgi:hypothetical protein
LSDRTEILLGSREGADLRIEEPGVTRNHCLLRVENGALMLVDLGSPDGVMFAGQAVRQARMAIGAAFRLGDVLIEVEELGAPPVAAQVGSPAGPPAGSPAGLAAPPPAPPAMPAPRAAPASAQTKLALEGGAAAAAAPQQPGGRPSGPVARHHHHQHDFGREIRQMVAQAPWYLVSAVVHALVLLVLWYIPYGYVPMEPPPGIQAVLDEGAGELEATPDEAEPDLESLADDEPEETFEEPEDPAAEQRNETDDMPALPDEKPPVIGLATPNYRVKLSMKDKQIKNGDAQVDRGNIQGEQKRAKDVVAKGLGRGIKRLQGLPANRVVVVQGEFDEIETVLDLYKVPHITIERRHLVSYNLRDAKVLCINCGRSPSSLQRAPLVNKVKKFAKDGGWVITSDWALAPYLTEAFPGFVTEITPRRRQTDTTVEVAAVRQNSPLLEGVFASRSKTRWWLEEASKFVGTKGNRVRVLVDSDEMRKRYGSRAVVVEFKPSRNGRVLHLMGHFYQKDGNHAGVVAMHRLIFNFLRERFPIRAANGERGPR